MQKYIHCTAAECDRRKVRDELDRKVELLWCWRIHEWMDVIVALAHTRLLLLSIYLPEAGRTPHTARM